MAKYLAKSEETLYILESSPDDKYLKDLKDLDIKYVLNPDISIRTFQLISTIYPSPGVSLEHEAFQYAKNLNIPIKTDIDIYLTKSNSYNILVTGTNGKTTTASMLEHLLLAFLKDVSVAAIGNIGKPVLECLDQKIDIAVIEISSFQIEASSELDSQIGILLNVEQDHLDRHKSFEIYKTLKSRVLKESSINISTIEHKINGKKFYDYENYFGAKISAEDGYDSEDIPEPPSGGCTNCLSAYFMHPEWDYDIADNFTTDIKSTSEFCNLKSWELTVYSSSFGDGQLEFNYTDVPEDMVIMIFSEEDSTLIHDNYIMDISLEANSVKQFLIILIDFS